MKKLIVTALAVLAVVSALKAQDVNERAYLYPVLNAQANNGRIAPKPKVEGFAAERVKENLDRGLIALQYTQG